MTSDAKTIGKNKSVFSLSSHGSSEFNVEIKENTSVINPSFIIRFPGGLGLSDYSTINYCYCSSLNRYYFVNNITLLTGQRLQFDCHIDVLETYKYQLKNIKAEIYRSEQKNIRSRFMIDDRLPVECKRTVEKRTIGNVGTGVTYCLTVAGGGSNG